MRPFLLKDKKFMSNIEKIRSTITNQTNSPTESPQQKLQTFIELTHTSAQKQTKLKVGKINSKVKKLKKTQDKLTEKANTSSSEEMRSTLKMASLISNEIQLIQSATFNNSQDSMRANKHLYSEMINKFWCTNGKEKKNHDTIMELCLLESSPMEYSENSSTMANEMASYHHNLQCPDPNTNNLDQTTAITSLLANMPHLPKHLRCALSEKITYSKVETALKNSPNNKAAGVNGIPTNLLKELHKLHNQNIKKNIPSFNIINLLKDAYNNIEENGISSPNIQNSWLCPLYKKGDCCEIPNYRPITVLNTEYKILTTSIMSKISEAAPSLIHKTQVAFVRGCSIFNQIDLAKRMINLCHIKNQNRVIILLDQEKAYDKIKHNYLWNTLKAAGLPPNLISTIKHLYSNTSSRVILNGQISESFTIGKGICQGDPLLSILFNFAIEPLSNLIRSSDSIKGLKINTPSSMHRVTSPSLQMMPQSS